MSNNPKDSMDYLKKLYNIDNWQKMHLQQLSYTRNLFILLASAGLGYTLSMLNNNMECEYEIPFKLICLFYLISIGFGAFIAYFESENYRLKYSIARKIESAKELTSINYKDDEIKCTKLESKNKILILLQLVFFIIGISIETILLLLK